MPLVGCGVTEFHWIDEGLEYFEKNVIREDFDCDLSVKSAYCTPPGPSLSVIAL
jgi:hypothetical protein